MRIEKLAIPLLRSTRNLSRSRAKSHVAPHPIPQLPVLDELEKRARAYLPSIPFRPSETAIVGAQHLLETTSSLFEKFHKLGFETYVTGKCYSTSPSVYKAMEQVGVHVWPGSKPKRLGDYLAACDKDVRTIFQEIEQNSRIKNILICDDGGRFIEGLPPYFRKRYRIAGVEQTRAGFYSRNLELGYFPFVNVAQSAVKLHVESIFIADASVKRISAITNQLNNRTSMVGIIGFGAIGQALANKLIRDGFSVAIFDIDPTKYQKYSQLKKVEIMPSIEQLFIHTNFIIGCTGRDNTQDFNPLTLNGHDRTIVSISSEDREFRSFLQSLAKNNPQINVDPLSNIKCFTHRENGLEILYGGFPVNFSNSATQSFNVPAPRIALTQGLMFSAVMQAFSFLGNESINPSNIMLDPDLQQTVVKLWLETTIKEKNLPKELIQRIITDKEWVIQHSQGFYDKSMDNNTCPSPISILTKTIS